MIAKVRRDRGGRGPELVANNLLPEVSLFSSHVKVLHDVRASLY